MRETVLLILTDHLNAGVDFAVKGGDGDAVQDMIAVLRGAMRQQLQERRQWTIGATFRRGEVLFPNEVPLFSLTFGN